MIWKWRWNVMAVILLLMIWTSTADARVFGRWRSHHGGANCSNASQKTAIQHADVAQKIATQKVYAGSYQEIAQQRANEMARLRIRGHLAGVPVGCFEGTGPGANATCVPLSGWEVAHAAAYDSDGNAYHVRLWTNYTTNRTRTVETTRYRPARRRFWRRA